MAIMSVPLYPDFAPISLEHKGEMHQQLLQTPDGVSEFTFAGLYLFRKRYQYRVSWLEGKTFIISGIQPSSDPETAGTRFFMTHCSAPGRGVLSELFKSHDYWKNISDMVLIPSRQKLEEWGLDFIEDRDNFDYLYLRTDLAELKGKKFHKKRNLIAQFLKLYENHEEKPLAPENIGEAIKILDKWRADKDDEGDYAACKEVLNLFGEFNMRGRLFYIDGKPVGWCLGEPIARGRMFTIHFEKGLEAYKGIYQYINQNFAASLPEYFTHINREQDLGDEGLRQAKMTYRPSGFVRKYKGLIRSSGS